MTLDRDAIRARAESVANPGWNPQDAHEWAKALSADVLLLLEPPAHEFWAAYGGFCAACGKRSQGHPNTT